MMSGLNILIYYFAAMFSVESVEDASPTHRISGGGIPLYLQRERQAIFCDDRDRKKYLEKLSVYCQEKGQ
jgi:hypothetical protein